MQTPNPSTQGARTLDDAAFPGARRAATDWAAVSLVIASGIIAALQVGKVTIGLSAMQADLGLSLEEAGWVMGIFAVMGLFGGIPVGAAVTGFGDRRLVILGLMALALGSAGGAFSMGLPALLVARIIEGTGFLLIVVAAPAVLDRISAPEDRGLVFGLWGTFMPAGIAIALLTGLFVEGWRGYWLGNAVLAGAMAVAMSSMVTPPMRVAADLSWRALGRDTRRTVGAGGPLLLAVSFALYNIQYFALVSFLPVLLAERLGVAPVTSAILSAIVVAANIVGNVLAGILLGRGLSRPALIIAASATMGLSGIAIFAATIPPSVIFLLCLLFSGVAGLLPATILATAPRVAPVPLLAPVSMGLVVQGSNLGQIIGPVSVGGVVGVGGWPAAAILVAGVGLLASALVVTFRQALGRG
jgi:MFS family permease